MTTAEVKLWGTRIGAVTFDPGHDLGYFQYDRDFLSSGIEVSPIVMPLSREVYSFPALSRGTFYGLPGLLADSLPDKFGSAVISAWLAAQGKEDKPMDPVERLCYTGRRGMGALEFGPSTGPGTCSSGPLQVERLREQASYVLKLGEGFGARIRDAGAMDDIVRAGTSAGGARAKILVAMNDETGELRSGETDLGPGYSYWLLKFDGVAENRDKEGCDRSQYTHIEYAYSLMAKAAGIVMSECRLLERDSHAHFMTKRFDRFGGSGDKLHMQTLGGLAHFDFNMPGAYGYEQAARIMMKLDLPYGDIEQHYRRMFFNIFCRNNDDHVKNISFLMDRRGVWRLAPAYDMTYSYAPGGLWTGGHQMTVNGKRDGIGRDDLYAAARAMGIKRRKAGSICAEMRAAGEQWHDFAAAAGLDEVTARRIQRTFMFI